MTPSLTLFTTCKPFRGHSKIIQRNALRSWRRLCPPCEVVIFGDEYGVDKCCEEFGFKQISNVARNDFGTPLVNNLFEQAEHSAAGDCLAYVNADIMLTGDILSATQKVSECFDKFLLIARRWNVDIDGEWDLQDSDWDLNVRQYAVAHGILEPPDGGADVFVFRRGIFDHLPPFAIGRSRCDSMLILEARRGGVPVIDATDVLPNLHQNHDYAHVAGTSAERPKGAESIVNENLLGGEQYMFTSLNATHVLTKSGILRNAIYE